MPIISIHKHLALRQVKEGKSFFQDYTLEMKKGLIPNKHAINYNTLAYYSDLDINKFNWFQNFKELSIDVLSNELHSLIEDVDLHKLLNEDFLRSINRTFHKTGIEYINGTLNFYEFSICDDLLTVALMLFKGNELIHFNSYDYNLKTFQSTVFDIYNKQEKNIVPNAAIWAIVKEFIDKDQLEVKQSKERKIKQKVGERIFNPDGILINIYHLPILENVKASIIKPTLVSQPYGPNNSLRKFVVRKAHVRREHTRIKSRL